MTDSPDGPPGAATLTGMLGGLVLAVDCPVTIGSPQAATPAARRRHRGAVPGTPAAPDQEPATPIHSAGTGC